MDEMGFLGIFGAVVLFVFIAFVLPNAEISASEYSELKIIYLESPSARPLIDEALIDGEVTFSEKEDIETFLEEFDKRFLLEAVEQ
ncbi:hypothetical protein QWY97_00005 [Vibrio cortegadensis]|uniref:hypothetical protein n=1 Tax=Vibrio cortegadensis TaxID=1328770 RepID=UPI0021C43BCE|nr:hypothetical protein [Vibrio cortegadensis]MDN3695737.1 hypothetical protein [Vibrio cortegadensis]